MSSAPVIDAMSAVVGSGNTVSISGHVTDLDPNAGAISVAISGPVAATIAADATGRFSYSGPASLLGTEQAVAADAGTGLLSASVQSLIQNVTPTIQNFAVSPTGNGQNVLLSGHVQDESPAGLSVSFSGAAAGSVVTDASGNFSLVVLASNLGNVTATTSDVWGASSLPAVATLSDPGPVVQLNAPQTGANGMVTISGAVSDLTPAGATVTISGAVSGTAVTDASGKFSLTAMPAGSGTVAVTAVNVWNQTSAPAQTILGTPTASSPSTVSATSTASTTLTLINLGSSYMGYGVWKITGTVQNCNPATTTVSYTGTDNGLVNLSPDGSFVFYVNASGNPNMAGWETCVATDAAGNQSAPQTTTFSL